MRNLKRPLSMLLAGAASSSDFTESDEITNIEAAQVMTDLGILGGTDIAVSGSTYVYCGSASGERIRANSSTVFVSNDDGDAEAVTASSLGTAAMNDESLFVITTNVTISGLSSYSESIETTAGTAANTILLTADDYSSRAYTIVVTRQALVQVTVEDNGAAAEGFDPSYAVQGTAVAFTVTPADDMSIQSVAWKNTSDEGTCTGGGTTYTLPAAAASSDVTITVTQSAIYSAMTGSFVMNGNDDVDAEDVIIGISENSYFDNTEDVTFTVQIPEDYHLERVTWMLAGDASATELTADENGVYTIASEDLADVDSGSNKLIIGVRLEANPTVTFSSGVTAWDAETGASLGSSTLSKVNEDGTYYLEFTCSDANLSTNAGSLSRTVSGGDYVYTLTNIPDSGATISSSGT